MEHVASDLEDALPNPHASPVIHVEICQASYSAVNSDQIKEHVKELLTQRKSCYSDFTIVQFDDPFLTEHVRYISVCGIDTLAKNGHVINLCSPDVQLHVYQLHEGGPCQEELEEEDLAAASLWYLPSEDFHGLWESLIFDTNVKNDLINYATTTLLFSDKNVDANIIAWNRVVLLHGPPGTGKTSLCKALAQKLVIHMSDRYKYGQLIEINSHSLFSKWFSEAPHTALQIWEDGSQFRRSGKLVMKMFQKIQELVDDRDGLICVLIDEVESLTAARKSSGTEPSDAIRVVNALLTQIDQIKKNPNVVILTTSNITGTIDLAFVDRADIKQYIGPPSPNAIYKIYQSCLNELMKCGIISPKQQVFDMNILESLTFEENTATHLSFKLRKIAVSSQGLSGRTLRKLPFLAHAIFIQSASVDLDSFLDALALTVKKQFEEREQLSNT